jgi:hypothetical protein
MLQYTGEGSIPAIKEFCGATRSIVFSALPRKDLMLSINRDVCYFMFLGDWIWLTGDTFAVGIPLSRDTAV